MMLYKILIQWFWVDVTTKALVFLVRVIFTIHSILLCFTKDPYVNERGIWSDNLPKKVKIPLQGMAEKGL